MVLNPAAITDSNAPFFPTDSAIRRVHREGVLILGGGRALLMQIAHPAVAKGVAEHSSYRVDRIARLLRTLRSTLAVVYGSRAQADAAVAGINHLHKHVNGEGYDALDPELLVWVLATLIDTTFEMHEHFVAPVPAEEAVRYYEDICVIGGLLGIPEGRMPSDLASLRRYVEEMSTSLVVSDTARTICADLFAPLPKMGPSLWLMRHLTAGLLHPALREGFGLSWGRGREMQLTGLQWSCRNVLRRMPLVLRGTPSFLLPPGSKL
jgi:uncharacterized protein (DUF2236 family)